MALLFIVRLSGGIGGEVVYSSCLLCVVYMKPKNI